MNWAAAVARSWPFLTTSCFHLGFFWTTTHWARFPRLVTTALTSFIAWSVLSGLLEAHPLVRTFFPLHVLHSYQRLGIKFRLKLTHSKGLLQHSAISVHFKLSSPLSLYWCWWETWTALVSVRKLLWSSSLFAFTIQKQACSSCCFISASHTSPVPAFSSREVLPICSILVTSVSVFWSDVQTSETKKRLCLQQTDSGITALFAWSYSSTCVRIPPPLGRLRIITYIFWNVWKMCRTKKKRCFY